MSDINNKEEMLKDLQFIKEAVRKNSNILKYISVSEGIKNVALLTGLFIIVLSVVLLWIIGDYGSYQELPDTVKSLVYTILILFVVIIAWFKIKSFLKIARKYREDMTILMLLKEVYTKTLLMIMIPFLISIIVFCVYLPINNLSHLIVSILAILISLLMTSFIITLNLKDFMLFSEWLLLSGLLSLFISDSIHPLIILIFTFGFAMLILYLSALVAISREKSG